MKIAIIPIALFVALAGIVPSAGQTQPAGTLAAYRAFLDSLDTKTPRSIAIARTTLEKRFSAASVGEGAEAFRAFTSFHNTIVKYCDRTYFWQTREGTARKDYQSALNEIISGNPGRLDRIPPEDDSMKILDTRDTEFKKALEAKYGAALNDLREYRRCGIRFSWGEGDWYAVADPGYLAAAGAFLKGGYREYLVFREREGKIRIGHDAGLMISWDELRQMILRYETFARDHPGLPETDTNIRPELHRLFAIYLTGMDNTTAYDLHLLNPPGRRGTGAIDPILRASYERFLAENNTSSFHPVITKVWDILTRNGFVFSKELDAYLVSAGYESFLFMYREQN